jgi:hypothetical protein
MEEEYNHSSVVDMIHHLSAAGGGGDGGAVWRCQDGPYGFGAYGMHRGRLGIGAAAVAFFLAAVFDSDPPCEVCSGQI